MDKHASIGNIDSYVNYTLVRSEPMSTGPKLMHHWQVSLVWFTVLCKLVVLVQSENISSSN